ncbi:MAG: hypothetical protein ACRD0K_20580 [Egibacteraceae bacterium]
MLLVTTAMPALAHGRGSDATNYSSRILRTPDLPGVTWRIYNSDEFLGVVNLGGGELVVPSYQSSQGTVPYLRINPQGVFLNRNSSAYFLNQDRLGTLSPPPGVGQGEPDWVQVSDEPRYAWHDHRIHWMARQDPQQVVGATGTTKVLDWEVPFTYDGQEQLVAGELLWSPGQPAWLWLLGALAVVAVPALAGLRTRPHDGVWPGLVRPAAVVLAVISVANLVHLVDDLTATPVPLTQSALTAVQTALFIAIGLFGACRAWQAREGAFTALAVGAGSIFVGQGLLYVSVLSASQVASVFPGWLTRAVVALSVAQVLPLAFVVFCGSRETLPPEPMPAEPATASP